MTSACGFVSQNRCGKQIHAVFDVFAFRGVCLCVPQEAGNQGRPSFFLWKLYPGSFRTWKEWGIFIIRPGKASLGAVAYRHYAKDVVIEDAAPLERHSLLLFPGFLASLLQKC